MILYGPRESETVRAERLEADAAPEPCDWGGCEREPEVTGSAFCWFHAEEYERMQRARNDEWWAP